MNNTPIVFDGSTLLTSLRSPFGRRVRLAFLEAGVRFSEKFVDVLKPTAELFAVNPLGRIPVVTLANGKTLIDSNLILMALYEGGGRGLVPSDAAERTEFYEWCALAAGLCEKTVEYFLDTLRPTELRDGELLTEFEGILGRLLPMIERRVTGRDWVVGSSISQADLDLGCALTYLALRYDSAWAERFPAAGAYLAKLEARPSFQKTRPPA